MSHPALLEQRLVPLSEIQKHPRNYKLHPEAQVAKVRASLKKFGQVKPILVREDRANMLRLATGYLIIAGHCVTEAARQLGWTEIAVVQAPAHWTDEDCLAYLVADNETSNEAEINELMLAELLEESKNSGYELEALGSSEEQLQALLEKLANEHLEASHHDTVIDDDLEDDNPLDGKSTTCPACGHIF